MVSRFDRKGRRKAIHVRIRNKVLGTAERPRIAFFKSARHVYGQIIDDGAGRTLVSASTLAKDLRGRVPKSGNVAAAKAVGEDLAEKALARNIKDAVFDRGGFLYHGAVKAFAEAMRAKGVRF